LEVFYFAAFSGDYWFCERKILTAVIKSNIYMGSGSQIEKSLFSSFLFILGKI